MYFPAVSNLGLIEGRKDENVLSEFSQSVKRNVAAEVASYMLLDSTPPSVLHTSFHLRWAMEAIGQAFSLPLEDERIINAAIEIYRRWALVPAKQPPCWSQEEQFFLQRVIMHSSLIFIPRSSSPNDLLRHLELCAQVMTVYTNIARQLDRRVSLETWEVFLKVLISVAEHLFHASESEFGRKISTQLIKVICEVLIRSRMQDPLLWETLKGFFVSWTHLVTVVTHWNMVTLALTKKAVNIIYGPTEGTEAVILKTDDTVSIDIDDDAVLYIWHRMLTVIGSPNSFHDARCYTLAFTGIEQVVKQFLKLGQVENPAQKSALDGNAVLHVFGAPLFQAVKADRIGFEEGTSLALKILASIFSTLNQTLWLPIYLAQFYDCLQGVMHKEGAVLIAGILTSSFVFSQGMEGANILVPSFLYAVRRIFAKKTTELSQFAPADQVRMACLKILGLIVCLPYHFDMTDLKYKPRSTLEHLHFTAYSELMPFISTIITEGMSSETHPANLTLLLNLTSVYIFQYVAQDAKFSTVAITWMVNGIVQKLWTKEVILRSLSVLSSVSALYKSLPKPEERARHVVSSLARSVVGLMDDQSHEIVAMTFFTITDWLQADQWILLPDSVDALNMTLEAVVQIFKTRDSGINIDPSLRRRGILQSKALQNPMQDDIWEAAELTLSTLLNQTGYWPTVAGPERLSTLLREEHELATLMQFVTPDQLPQYVRFFITSDARMLLTIIDQPFRAGDPSVTIIVRSKAGRFSWSIQSTTLPFLDRGAPSSLFRDVPPSSAADPIITQDQEMEESSFPDLFQFLKTSAGELRHSPKVLAATEKQAHKEVIHLSRNQFGLAVDITLPVPIAPNPHEAGMGKVPEARVLLSNLGLFNENGYHRMYPISMTDQLMGALDVLDNTWERETFSIAVCMVNNTKGVVANGNASLEFMQFVLGLGWIVNPTTHRGYQGNADLNGIDRTVYWANHRTELMFHVTPMLPNARYAADDTVAVLWIEDQPNYDFSVRFFIAVISASFFHNKAFPQLQVAIIVLPLPSGMYQLRVLRRLEKPTPIGPIQDGMILGRTVLGQLVRETALTAVRTQMFVHEADNNYMPPTLRRQMALDEIGKRFASIDCTSAQFLGTMFTAARELRARGMLATANNTARGRGNTNVPGSSGTGGSMTSPMLTGGLASPHGVPLPSPSSKATPPGSYMGTARGTGGGIENRKDALPPDELPRVTPTSAVPTLRSVGASPTPTPVGAASPQWRAPDVWKPTGAAVEPAPSSPSTGSQLRDRMVVDTREPNKPGSGRQLGVLTDSGLPTDKRQSRVMISKDITSAMEQEAVNSGSGRSGSFSAASPATVIPLSAAPKLELGRRPTGGFIGKEPVKPPSPAGTVGGSGIVLPTSPQGNPAPLGSASNWKPAVTKTPVLKP